MVYEFIGPKIMKFRKLDALILDSGCLILDGKGVRRKII
jgi:hypothetical protein